MHLKKHLPENLSHAPLLCLPSTNSYLDTALSSDFEILVPIPATWLGVPEEQGWKYVHFSLPIYPHTARHTSFLGLL